MVFKTSFRGSCWARAAIFIPIHRCCIQSEKVKLLTILRCHFQNEQGILQTRPLLGPRFQSPLLGTWGQLFPIYCLRSGFHYKGQCRTKWDDQGFISPPHCKIAAGISSLGPSAVEPWTRLFPVAYCLILKWRGQRVNLGLSLCCARALPLSYTYITLD